MHFSPWMLLTCLASRKRPRDGFSVRGPDHKGIDLMANRNNNPRGESEGPGAAGVRALATPQLKASIIEYQRRLASLGQDDAEARLVAEKLIRVGEDELRRRGEARYAVVVIVQATASEEAWEAVSGALRASEGDSCAVYISAPWEGIPHEWEEFATAGIELGSPGSPSVDLTPCD